MYIGARVELELVDPSRNARRFYALTVIADPQLPLFPGEPPGVVLVVAWGRLEGLRRVARKRYTSPEHPALERTWRELLGRRRRHGYVETTR